MMSPEVIIKMPAGREMDALIAVEALGWKEVPYYGVRTFLWPGYKSSLVMHPTTGLAVPDRPGNMPLMLEQQDGFGLLPFYSTDITAVKVVMQAISAANYALQILLLPTGVVTARVTPVPSDDKQWPAHYEAGGETMELAICRAYLLAVAAMQLQEVQLALH